MDSQALPRILAEIAETASETLELQEIFDRVATSIRELIPFDNMGVVRILDGQRALLHAATFGCRNEAPPCSEPMPLTHWSPRMRPRPGQVPRIDDAPAGLDPAFPLDAAMLDEGVRSALWEPFHSGGSFPGGVWLSATSAQAFTDSHQVVLRPIAALLGSAVEHWRIWDAERQRRERLDRLEALLGTFADSLDVRAVFKRISEGIRPILPHDMMVLAEIDGRARSFRLVAVAGESDLAGQRMTGDVANVLAIIQELRARTACRQTSCSYR